MRLLTCRREKGNSGSTRLAGLRNLIRPRCPQSGGPCAPTGVTWWTDRSVSGDIGVPPPSLVAPVPRKWGRGGGAGPSARMTSTTASCTRPFVARALPCQGPGSPSSEVNPAAGLLDDRHEGGHVPGLQVGLARDVEDPFGDEHVRPHVPVGPGPQTFGTTRSGCPAGRRRPTAGCCCSSGSRRPGRRHRRPGAARRTSARPVPPPPTSACRGRGALTTPSTGRAVHGERDERRPDRHAAQVVRRAVDRVHDPLPVPSLSASAPCVRRGLLAEERVIGTLCRQTLAEGPLDGLVGVRHVRAVGLLRHVQVGRTEPREADGVCGVGEGTGEVQVGAEVHDGQRSVS